MTNTEINSITETNDNGNENIQHGVVNTVWWSKTVLIGYVTI